MNEMINQETRPTAELTRSLKGLLRFYSDVAYVVGVKQEQTVRNWAEHDVEPANPLMRRRLEVAEMLAKIVAPRELPHVPATWLIANNPYVDEEQPCVMIQSLQGDETDMETVEKLVHAAESFAASAA